MFQDAIRTGTELAGGVPALLLRADQPGHMRLLITVWREAERLGFPVRGDLGRLVRQSELYLQSAPVVRT